MQDSDRPPIYTLSKSYAMTGWRVGYVASLTKPLSQMEKAHGTYGVRGPQHDSSGRPWPPLKDPRTVSNRWWQNMRNAEIFLINGLNRIQGSPASKPESTFSMRFPTSPHLGMSSREFARHMVENYKVAMVPGSIFVRTAKGLVRIPLPPARQIWKRH